MRKISRYGKSYSWLQSYKEQLDKMTLEELREECKKNEHRSNMGSRNLFICILVMFLFSTALVVADGLQIIDMSRTIPLYDSNTQRCTSTLFQQGPYL